MTFRFDPMLRLISENIRRSVMIALTGVFIGSAARTDAETVLLAGATVHTVSGDTLQPGFVVIDGEKIVSVGTNKPVADRTIDLTGLHLYPGIIDADTVLGLNEIDAVRASVDDREVGAYTPEVSAWVSINPDSELIPVARVNGITHVNAMPSGGVVAGQSSLIRLAGWTIEDLAEKKQTGLNIYWPSMDLNTSPDNKKSLKDQDRDRKMALRELDRFFNEATAYAKARAAGSASVDVVPAWEAMLPYVRGELPVFVHAEEIRQLRAALKWIEERKLKAAIFGGRDAWQMAHELAAAKIPVVYDAVHELPEGELDGYDAHFKAPALLVEAGVNVAISLGKDMEESRARNLPYAAAQAMAYGLPADAALRSVTLSPAEILGVADRLGSIEAGKEASLFAADGDILDIRSNVKHLWIAGQEVSLETRHTRLYEKYRNRPLR